MAAARTSDVWRGWIALGDREGKVVGETGYEGASYRVADVILGAQGDFVGWLRGFQLLFESFRLPFGDGSRVSRLQRTALLLSPCRFDLPFFGISPRTQAAVSPTNRIKVRFEHFRPKVDSGTIVLHVVSWNREIIDPFTPWISMLKYRSLIVLSD